MNTKILVAGALLVGAVEVTLLARPEVWDDLIYELKGVSEWMQSRNGWLTKQAPR